MTHFASAADYTSPQTDEQSPTSTPLPASCGPAGVQRRAPSYLQHQRHRLRAHGGLAQPWCAPGTRSTGTSRRRAATLRRNCWRSSPALTWKAKLLAVKDIPEGALVGYGGTFRAPRPMRIGILGAGYADGMFHRLSNRGKVIADGKLTPILGTISMDLTTIDLSHTAALRPGDEVTLLGAEGDASLDAQQIARVAGTISYNILCSISARVRRVYV